MALLAPTAATAAVLASPVKLPTTAMSEALKSCSRMAVAATGRAKRGILLQMGPCSMSSCCFAWVCNVIVSFLMLFLTGYPRLIRANTVFRG